MRRRLLQLIGVAALFMAVIILLKLAPTPVAGQGQEGTASVDPTPWGDPNLQGIWTTDYETPLQRPTRYANKDFFTDEERDDLDRLRVDSLARNEGRTQYTVGAYNAGIFLSHKHTGRRTSLIVDPPDGRLPARTPEAEQRAEARRAVERPPFPRGPEDLGGGLRCGGGRVPMTGRGYNSNYQIVQSAGHVAILMEMMHDTRIIPLDDRPHLTSAVRTALGDARGHWEGDTLVVETTNLKRGSGGATRELRLVERFTRVAQDTLQYEYTMHDPTTWTQPWTARIFMRPAPGTGVIYEFACHEGNYALEHTLRGARLQEGR